MDGIKKAKDRGVQFGKRPALSEDQIVELRKKRTAGMLIKDLMRKQPNRNLKGVFCTQPHSTPCGPAEPKSLAETAARRQAPTP